jgi:hypothetical protein
MSGRTGRWQTEVGQDRSELRRLVDVLIQDEVKLHHAPRKCADPGLVGTQQCDAQRQDAEAGEGAGLCPAQAVFPALPLHVAPDIRALLLLEEERGGSMPGARKIGPRRNGFQTMRTSWRRAPSSMRMTLR